MNRRTIMRTVQITVIGLTAAAIVQELSRPREERRGYGRVLRFIPYDFRLPTWERVKESYWNPYERHILSPQVTGIGWTVNFYRLLENLGFMQRTAFSEESFLMPNKRIRQIMQARNPELHKDS